MERVVNNMTLYLYELKSGSKSLIVWIVCIIGFFGFSMSMFPTFSKNAGAVNDMMKTFPPEMLGALGIDFIDFSKPLDYMAYMFQYMLVAVGAFSIMMSGSLIAKEEDEKTIEFLYAKPITRHYIIRAKLAAIITNIFIVAGSFYLATLGIMIAVSDNVDLSIVFLVSLGMFLFMLLFSSIGSVLGIFIIKGRKRMPFGLGIIFFMYFMSIMSGVDNSMENLKYVTPYKYFEALPIIRSGQFELLYIIITVSIIVIGYISTFILYRKKDMAV